MTDENLLIAKTLEGDMQAFRWLIKRYERLVSHVVGRIVRDDFEKEEICQDVFLKVHEKLHTFRRESKLSTWIVTIAYRTSLNHVAKSRKENVSLSDIREPAALEVTSSSVEHEDLKMMLEEAIMALPLAHRTVITLFHMEDHSYDEVTEVTGLPLGTVKSYLFRGRKMLKDYLEKRQIVNAS
jgi:RNA polymerase sigma-70 factor (ECF subfamily)